MNKKINTELGMIFKITKIIVFLVALFSISFVCLFFISPTTLIDIYRGEDETTIWVEVKYLPIKKIISDDDNYKFSDLQWSPNKKLMAFYDNVKLETFEKEWALKIINPRTFNIKTVFIGDYKTGEYKWLDNNTVRVYESAGSGVKAYRDINTNIDKPVIKVEDWSSGNWTPEKTY